MSEYFKQQMSKPVDLMSPQEIEEQLELIYEEEEMNKKERDYETMDRLKKIEDKVNMIFNYLLQPNKEGGNAQQGSEGVTKVSGASENDKK